MGMRNQNMLNVTHRTILKRLGENIRPHINHNIPAQSKAGTLADILSAMLTGIIAHRAVTEGARYTF